MPLRFALLFSLLLNMGLSYGQGIPNGNFSQQYSTADGIVLPSNFRVRAKTITYHKYDPNTGRNESGSGHFDTQGKEIATGYFYGFYDASGKQPEYLSVRPGDKFECTIYYKMDAAFHQSKGSAVYLQALFFNDGTARVRPQAQVDSKRSSTFDPQNPQQWYALRYTFEVPKEVSHMGIGVYFKGNGKVWLDEFSLKQLDEPNDTEDLVANEFSLDAVPFSPMVQIVSDQNDRMQQALENYEERNKAKGTHLADSLWTLRESNCHPQIRLTANIASAVFNSKKLYPKGSAMHQKALNALDWLMANQEANGSFLWYPSTECDRPVKDEGSLMYEGSIALMALRDGFLASDQQQERERLYQAAKRFCDYLLTTSPQANTNFNGFALWALSNFITLKPDAPGMEVYADKSWSFFKHIERQQTRAGNWPDFHNKHVYYHAIITRGIASLYLAQEKLQLFNAEQALRLKKSSYRAVNYLLAQIETAEGDLRKHPDIDTQTVKSPFALEVVLLALEFPELSTSEKRHLEALSALLTNFSIMSTQGHEIAALGRYLDFKGK
ncbi:hypothetical protein [Gilvibacter sp.]|uniref:hypothetical protein n=1 Tax=Gilvibacter sp. TaxID=2729997 RepID=UPI003F4A5DF5